MGSVEAGAPEEPETRLEHQEETNKTDTNVLYRSNNVTVLVPELLETAQIKEKAFVPVIDNTLHLSTEESEFPQQSNNISRSSANTTQPKQENTPKSTAKTIQSKQGGIPKSTAKNTQSKYGYISKSLAKYNPFKRNDTQKSPKETKPEKGNILKPKEEAIQPKQGDILKSSTKNIQPKDSYVPKSLEETIQPKEGDVIESSEETGQPKEGDVPKSSEETSQSKEGDVPMSSEETSQPKDAPKSSEVTQPKDGNIPKSSKEGIQLEEGDILKSEEEMMEYLEVDMVKIILSKEDFKAALKEAGEKLVAVEFSASWCGPCRTIRPFFHSLSLEHNDMVFLEVDADDCEDLVKDCDVFCIPTFQFYKKENKVGEFCGAQREKLRATIAELK